MASDCAFNYVLCKLFDLVDSPPEQILGAAVFKHLSDNGWYCWVHSDFEYRTFVAPEERPAKPDTFALVPQFEIADVGRVDIAIFVPQISRLVPLVVVECDGHDYHERTPEQADNDNRRDCALQRRGIFVRRFTATTVKRNLSDAAREIAQIVHEKLDEATERAQAEDVLSYLACAEGQVADLQSRLEHAETLIDYARAGLPVL